jgi:hypothetical protein
MAQIVPLSVWLGPAYTGLAIGYTVFELDNSTVYSAFTTVGVGEDPVGSGDYHVADGIEAPTEGGYVSAGTIGNELIRGPVEPKTTSVGGISAIEWPYLVTNTNNGDPIPGVQVEFNVVGNPVWFGITDAFGYARDGNGDHPFLEPGAYDVVSFKVGWIFPDDVENVA